MIWFNSPAKINRFLIIKGRMENGYHEIVTLFEKLEFFDRLGYELLDDPQGNIELECPEWLSPGPENLVYKAIKLFQKQTMIPFSIRVRIEKQIPAGAGLGGGSSNCGTTLKALNQLLEAGLSQDVLMDMASKIGADCAFFATDWTSALGTGTGSRLEEVSVEPLWYLLVLPDFGVSTKWAYQNFKLTRGADETIFDPRKASSGYVWINDLEAPVCARYPAITRIKEYLLESGARVALMSGSGSTVFGVFPDRSKAAEAGKVIGKETGYRCLVTKTLEQGN